MNSMNSRVRWFFVLIVSVAAVIGPHAGAAADVPGPSSPGWPFKFETTPVTFSDTWTTGENGGLCAGFVTAKGVATASPLGFATPPTEWDPNIELRDIPHHVSLNLVSGSWLLGSTGFPVLGCAVTVTVQWVNLDTDAHGSVSHAVCPYSRPFLYDGLLPNCQDPTLNFVTGPGRVHAIVTTNALHVSGTADFTVP